MSESVVDQWLAIWTQEFSRAIEMFSGQQPTITYSRAKQLAPTEMGDLLWWHQSFEADRSFSNWVGAKEATWMAIGAVAGDPEAEAAKAAYLEILGQAQNGVASVIGPRNGRTVRCAEGEFGAAPDFHTLEYALIGLQIDGAQLPSLALALEPSVQQLLEPEKDDQEDEIPVQPRALGAPAGAASETTAMTPMLSRLMELELPLSVALGRSKMAISEVLKVNPGSVIELDRNIGEHVELIVHGTVVARGEVVSVRGNYGVRIKEIISRQDRMSLYSGK